MQVRIFVTDNGTSEGTSPVLYVEDRPGVSMPAHPKQGQWRYFATVRLTDPLLSLEAATLREKLAEGRPHIGDRLPF